MATTVTWVQNGNGEYEISSAQHLKQLMNKGALYTDAGTPPTDYWLSSSYVQTANIDLLGDNTDIKPIGNNGDIFTGSYDGSNFAISNWSYIDPDLNASNTNLIERYIGLFGRGGDVTLKNIRLNGVCIILGVNRFGGFLIGGNDVSGTSTISNIECDLSPGSFIQTAGVEFDNPNISIGGICGFIGGTQCTALTLKGSLDFFCGSLGFVGGVIGTVFSHATGIQNLATFPFGIRAGVAGGVCGIFRGSTATKMINVMTGNINGATSAGGIIGDTATDDIVFDNLVNSMKGDISTTLSGSGSGGTGGIFGTIRGQACSNLMNYMSGSISNASTNFSTTSGGIFGRIVSGLTVTDSVVAMNGNVPRSVYGENAVANIADIQVSGDTSFGMTFTTQQSTAIVYPPGLLNTDFPDFPYSPLDFLDGDGNSHEFNFVFGNLAGNSSYSSYTHLVLHKGDICAPVEVDFDIPENSSTVYLTFLNSVSGVILQESLQLALPEGTLQLSVRSINILVRIGRVTDASSYSITYDGPSGEEVTAFSGFTELSKNIINLDPETQYTIRLYADTGSGYVLSNESVVTTLLNTASSYDVTDFELNGIVNISNLGTDLDVVIDNLFATGDIVGVSFPSDPSVKSSFIKRGETLNITDVNSTLIPFSVSSGTGQNVSVILSDGVTTVPITYDETDESITINSVAYNTGDSFILDGKKVTVYDIL